MTTPAAGYPDIAAEVAVVIPARNSSLSVVAAITGVRRYFDQVIVVDDASTDRTAVFARQAGAQVVHHPTALGHTAALRTGLRHALRRFPQAQWLVTLDAEGDYDATDAMAMVLAARARDMQAVLGSRATAGARRRRFSRSALAQFSDPDTELRVLHRDVALALDGDLVRPDWRKAMVSRLVRLRFCEYPVQWSGPSLA